MTRLIDADEIVYEETLRCAGRTGNSSTYYHDYHVWAHDIDKMPTVDAIPISFIFDKMSIINSEYIDIQRLIDTEPETAAKRIGIVTNLLCEYNALRDLIREWRGNENGKTD